MEPVNVIIDSIGDTSYTFILYLMYVLFLLDHTYND